MSYLNVLSCHCQQRLTINKETSVTSNLTKRVTFHVYNICLQYLMLNLFDI